MYKFTFFALPIGAISLFIVSCTKEVSLDAGEDEIVVECILSCDSVQTLNLLCTHHMDLRNERTTISEADITLFDETTFNYTGQFLYSKGGWVLPYAALPNHKYRLDIDIPGHEHISAVQKMQFFLYAALSMTARTLILQNL